jgi:hypothetical protein
MNQAVIHQLTSALKNNENLQKGLETTDEKILHWRNKIKSILETTLNKVY